MPHQGSIIKGVIICIIVPFVGFAITLMVVDFVFSHTTAREIFHTRTLHLIAICFNLLVINFFKSRKENKSLRGALFTTMLLAIIWLIYYGQELF